MYDDIAEVTGISTSVEGRLADKSALVVGGGQTPGQTIGNGRATAILFARAGARVMVADRDLDRAEDTAAFIRSEGGDAAAHECDIADEGECASMIERAMQHLDRIDVLHNNVGIGSHDGSPTRITNEGLDLILDVNLKGLVFTCKYAVPHMQAAGSGSIINISSVAAITPYAGVGYKTTKAAVNAYTQTLAMRVAGDGVRANVIMPGLMNTPMAIEGNVERRDVSREDVIAQRDRLVPLGRRMGSGWDIAHAALFLASDESRFITGIDLAVDGGSSARRG
ncbi:MAG: SDR family NAD(P)-dependent oxidoreductase [Actinomycetota bacterium]|jgi:NAD(P)-dependent dehydrogenase (short-subunit alcohol dehydrogenase family)|nr:SDR family NAD(P)-dependent oxidoreductase [Actinomycetota bacterium]